MLTILAPKGEVFPYIENAKKYLEAGADANVADYFIEVRNQQVPIQVVWQYDGEGVEKFLVEYGRKEDFSDAISVETAGDARAVDLYNLYKASDYFVRVIAYNKQGEVLESTESGFYTTSLGPRVMNIDGICNVRDFGGWKTESGKEIVQGIAYRGGSPMPLPRDPLDTVITDMGKAYLRDTLGVRTELDLRSAEESGIYGEGVIFAEFSSSLTTVPVRRTGDRCQHAVAGAIDKNGGLNPVELLGCCLIPRDFSQPVTLHLTGHTGAIKQYFKSRLLPCRTVKHAIPY